MGPVQRREMSRHQFEKRQTRQQRKSQRAKESFPCFLWANVRNQRMPPNDAAGKISAHVAELRDRDYIKAVKLSHDCARFRSRHHIENFGHEIEKPQDTEKSEEGVGHRLQRFVLA